MSLRTFSPLPADHFAVREKQQCAVCHRAFEVGDVTTLIPVDPHPEVPGPKSVQALMAHAECVRSME